MGGTCGAYGEGEEVNSAVCCGKLKPEGKKPLAIFKHILQ
jgi:hypothetical protein